MATLNGWPEVSEQGVVRIVVGGDANGATVLAGDAATAFRWLLEQFHTRVEPIIEVNGWRSAAFNKQVGGATRSNHISGTAVDVNGGRHPFEAHHPGKTYSSGFTAAQEREVRSILREARLFAWGLDFPVGRRDAMHFELAPGTSKTDVARFVATLSKEDEDMAITQDDLENIREAAANGTAQLFAEMGTGATRRGRNARNALQAVVGVDEQALGAALAELGVSGVDVSKLATTLSKRVLDDMRKRLEA